MATRGIAKRIVKTPWQGTALAMLAFGLAIFNALYATQALLPTLTTELAVQWARHSIRVNTLAPGFFRSEITDELYDGERGADWLRRNTPLPMEGGVEDFVGAVLWLVSDAGRYVTGQTIVVDGGWTAR